MSSKIRVGVVGASGYVGLELIRLLQSHGHVEIAFLGGRNEHDLPLDQIAPAFTGHVNPLTIQAYEPDRIQSLCDVVFCALPHGQSGAVAQALLQRQRIVIDLSADFRLRDPKLVEQWYGPPQAPEWIGKAAYGLPELYRAQIKTANLIAVPGCHATAAILATAPLVAHHLVDVSTLVIDSKTGVSGAGKHPSASTHFVHVDGGIRAYKTAGAHRHIPEIEQALSDVSGQRIQVTFSPQLVPMSRGILITAYGKLIDPTTSAEKIDALMREFYDQSFFVKVLKRDAHPDTIWTRGANYCHVAYNVDTRTGYVIAQATLDNLVKGASGQAIQCMNVRMGLPEHTGLTTTGFFL